MSAREEWPLAKGEHRTEMVQPLRGVPPINCRTCLREIEAYALVSIHGMSAGYAWRHVTTQSMQCAPAPRRVEPYDHYEADRRLVHRVEA